MDTVIKYKDGKDWILFDNIDINCQTRTHCINLFSNGIPVIASESGTFITNSAEWLKKYKEQGKKIIKFSDCEPSEQSFESVGFLV